MTPAESNHAAARAKAFAANSASGALAQAVARLEAAGVPSAPLAAELLLLHVLDRDRAWLYAHPEAVMDADQLAAYANLIDLRGAGMPVQYLTGHQEFWGLEFEVNSSVLIPRPETEHLIEVAIERLGGRRNAPLQIADVGTGSGCIAVALAREFPQAQIVATDISPAALEVAHRNATRHGVSNRITMLQMDLLQSYLGGGDKAPQRTFDLIVSNPPYVARAEQNQLQREVIEHEPHEALFAGEEGLDVYPELIAQAAKLLRRNGLLIVELGQGQAESVSAMIAADAAWTSTSITNDLAGIPRVLAAERIST